MIQDWSLKVTAALAIAQKLPESQTLGKRVYLLMADFFHTFWKNFLVLAVAFLGYEM